MTAQITIWVGHVEMRHIQTWLENLKGSPMRNSENNTKMNLKRYKAWGNCLVSRDRENTDKLSRSTKGGE